MINSYRFNSKKIFNSITGALIALLFPISCHFKDLKLLILLLVKTSKKILIFLS